MRRYLIFRNNKDIIMTRILSEEEDKTIKIVDRATEKEYYPIKYKLGEFVVPLYINDVDSKFKLSKLKKSRDIVATNKSDGLTTVKDAAEFLDAYARDVEFSKNKYYVDSKTGDIMYLTKYDIYNSDIGEYCPEYEAHHIDYPFNIKTSKNPDYILEFDDDTDDSAKLWAEIQGDEYKALASDCLK